MRHVTSMLLLVLCLAACEPAFGYSSTQLVQETAQATNSEPAPSARLDPPPRPVCEQYDALEHGAGDWQTQDWFDHLPARDGDKGYARVVLACRYGQQSQFAALDELWQLEADGGDDRNGFDWHATNVPQAKPFSKMGCTTIDHRCQVRWGLGYIEQRYGGPAAALSSWRARSPHWY